MEITLNVQRSILFFGDTHTGSPWAPWPTGFFTPEGNEIVPSPGQMKLLSYWEDLQNWADKLKVDTVVSLGDLIDGPAKKGQPAGGSVLRADLNSQIEAARILIAPLVSGRKFYGISGTPYHDSSEGKAEKFLIEDLGGQYKGTIWNAEFAGKVFHIAHGEGGSTVYRATKMDRDLLFALAAEGGQEMDFHIDFFVRAHAHFYGFLDFKKNGFIQVPGFADWIPYRFSMRVYGRKPDIGFVVVLILDDGEIMLRTKKYPLPHISDSLERAA